MRFVLLAVLTTLTLQAYAKYEIPADDKVLHQLGECRTEFLPPQFQLFVWNIKKAEAQDKWARDFELFTPRSHLVLIQEAMIDDFMPAIVLRQPGFCWDFAASFLDNSRNPTGVMTGSLIRPLSMQFLRSPGREPVINTPKMVIVHEYALANSLETLLVANIHGLNATTNKLNREQIEQVAAVLQKHTGPLIFAGDFNSWNKDRLDFLDEILGRLGMKKLSFEKDRRRFKLDHIYVRGLQTVATELHNDIDTSDHKPLSAMFSL
ncbi:MAG: endonuclease/exonuclease/phosphatase family protein [Bdellovibrio sp.]